MQPITAIVETPKGSAEKFDYEPEFKMFKLNKIMPVGMVFPYDFGFIPHTKAGDGDPLDILILSEFKTFPSCMIDCRLIGAITANQTERDRKTVRNDRFIAVPVVSHQYEKINTLEELPQKIVDEIIHFFKAYNEISGKIFEPVGNLNADAAYQLLQENQHQ